MNKKCCCAGRLRISIRLECKINSQFKKSFFQQIMNFAPKVFRSWFDPKDSYKTISKRRLTAETERIIKRYISDRIKDRWRPTNPHHNQQPYNQVPGISITWSRSFIAYRPTSYQCVASKQTSHLKTTYTHSRPDPYLVEEESLYLFLSTDFYSFKINEIKSDPLVRWLFQPYACLLYFIARDLRIVYISCLCCFSSHFRSLDLVILFPVPVQFLFLLSFTAIIN